MAYRLDDINFLRDHDHLTLEFTTALDNISGNAVNFNVAALSPYTDYDSSSVTGNYINYGLNGYANPWLDFGTDFGNDHDDDHDHDHAEINLSGPQFSGVGDEYADDAANTNGLGLGSIVIGGRAEGVRNDGNDIDFFEVDLVAGQEYIFIMLRDSVDSANPHGDPLLNLYGTNGTSLLAINNDFGGDNSRITFTAAETGTHYLGASGAQANTGGYTLFAEEIDQRPDFTLDEIAYFLTDQFSTRSLWNQTTITYNVDAIDDGAAGEATKADGSAYVVLPILEAALEAWAEVTGLNFVQVTGAGNGDITFIDNQGGAYSSSTTTAGSNGARTILSSTINVSHNGWIDNYGDSINSYSYQTYIHEIGHTLGLGHGGAYNGSADYGDDNTYIQDSWATTIMSYFSHGEAGVGTSRLVLGLQPADILAIHDLYGAAAATRGGNTVYGANATEAGSIYDFDAWDAQGIRPPSFAIYDTGGIDTFDVSIYSTNQTINLMPSGDLISLSSVGNNGGTALSNTISIAVGTIIENAIGGSGNDTITGNDVSNELEGNAGNDILDGGDGIDYAVYNGAQAAYTLTENIDGTWTITGEGTDTLSNIEFARFTDGDVSLAAGGIDGTPGNDNLVGTAGNDVINGLAGNDILDGLGGDDVLNGGDGADRFIGGEGADTMNGGAGFDSVDYRGAASRVAFNVDTGGTVGDAAGDTYSGIERYYLSDFNDTITGSSANEFFYGEGGNDTINGGGGIDRIYGGDGNDIQRGQDGNDTLYGSAGSDQLNGGTGFDVANYSNATTQVTVNLASGGTGGDAAGDTYFGIEAVYGSDFNDTLTGNASTNELRGGVGDDTLDGAGGNDRLYGGLGGDVLNGGTGTDSIYYTFAAEGVTLNLTTGGTAGEAAGDSFTSIEWVFGSGFDDDLTGDAGNNRLYGQDGNDTLNGAGGNDRILGGDGDDIIDGGDGVDILFGQDGDDTMSGGLGNDFFYGGDGADSFDGGADFDTVNYLAASSGVSFDMTTTGLTGEAAGDTYVSIERILGTGFDDAMRGSAGDDILLGNGGNDYIEGGSGNDSLNGGAGVDSFGYFTNGSDSDVISGFTTNEVIYILSSDPAFDSWAEVQAVGADAGANVIFNFGGGNTLTIVGKNLADLDASNFDFGGTAPAAPPPAGETLDDSDAFAADITDAFDMDALI